jgi:hypothetical protein
MSIVRASVVKSCRVKRTIDRQAHRGFNLNSGQTRCLQTYAPTCIASLNLGAMAGFVTRFFVGLITLISLPLSTLVADRVNRRSMLIVVTLTAAVTAYPLLAWLAAAPSVFRFVVFELWFSFMYGACMGPSARSRWR